MALPMSRMHNGDAWSASYSVAQMPHCPKDWFSWDLPHTVDKEHHLAVQWTLIDHLLPFEGIAQDLIMNLLDNISGSREPFIPIGTLTLQLTEFNKIIKYGKLLGKHCPELQQVALDLLESGAEKEGLSLSEVKLAYCVASLKGLVKLDLHTENHDRAKTKMLENLLGKDWDDQRIVEYGVDMVKLKEFLRCLLDYNIRVLQPIYRCWELS